MVVASNKNERGERESWARLPLQTGKNMTYIHSLPSSKIQPLPPPTGSEERDVSTLSRPPQRGIKM
jgi:hypothetical protein